MLNAFSKKVPLRQNELAIIVVQGSLNGTRFGGHLPRAANVAGTFLGGVPSL